MRRSEEIPVRIDAILPAISARLATISPDTPFVSAARLFGQGGFRILVVCQDDRALGIITRGDAMRHVGEHENPLTVVVAELMTATFTSARPSDDLLATWKAMAAARLNHVPILDEAGTPLGVLTADDALRALFESDEYEEHLLGDYIAGLGYR